MPPTRAQSQTPGPTTRARASRQNTPAPTQASASRPTGRSSAVPTLAVGQNFAYGSSGKAVLRGQVATEKTSLTSVLQQRTAKTPAPAIEEGDDDDDEEREPSPILQPTSSNGIRRQRTQPTAQNSSRFIRLAAHGADDASKMARRSAADGAEDLARDDTRIDRAATYAERQRARAAARIPAVEPADWQVTANTVPRYMRALHEMFTMDQDRWTTKNSILALIGGLIGILIGLGGMMCFLYGFTIVATVPKFMVPWQQNVASALHYYGGVFPYDMPPDELARLWVTFRYEHETLKEYPDSNMTQFGINIAHMMKLKRHETRIEKLEERVGLHDDTLKMLGDMIPNAVVVQQDGEGWQIPENFWQALHSKLSGEHDLWDVYIRKNDAHVDALSETAVNNRLDAALEKGVVVSKKAFQDGLDRNQRNLQFEFTQQLREAERAIIAKAKRAASERAADIIQNSPKLRLSETEANALAYANIVLNQQKVLEQVNFFSIGLGARVDPKQCSPTAGKKKFGWGYQLGSPHPPIAALQRWEEATECWCAAESTEMGKAQLTVQMMHTIYPKTLVIENVPARGTIDISAAPKDFSVWTEVDSSEKARHLTDLSLRYFETDSVACGEAPSDRHICLGSGRYDIHAANWVQSFHLAVASDELGMASKKLTIRVQNNWGGSHTCLYRLRMTGEEVFPQSAGEL